MSRAAQDQRITLRRMPNWFVTLFSTDMLERFAFYGLQAILVLYAAAPSERGGLGMPAEDAASLFGAWLAVMFMLSLPGGWLGDRVLGQRRAILLGAATAVAGYLCLIIPAAWSTALGLCALAAGTGLYMPNYQAQGNLMLNDPRGREQAVSFIYVASQISALLAPLAAGYLGERVDWRLAFAVCAASLALGGLNVLVRGRHFGEKGREPGRPLAAGERAVVVRWVVVVAGCLVTLLLALGIGGMLTPGSAIALSGLLSVITPVIGYRWLFKDRQLSARDRRRLKAFLAVFLGATLFWMIIAHAASLLNLFARDHVDREILGFTFPASWLQSVSPLLILVLAPGIAAVLPRLGRRHNVPVKFAIGLSLVGFGFLVMSLAALIAAGGNKVSPLWMVVVYLTAACGEVVIAAVSIAATASVLPPQFMGRMLGMYWLFASLGGALGAGVVRLASVLPESVYYLSLGGFTALAGIAFAVWRRPLSSALSRDEHPEAAGRTQSHSNEPA